MSWVCPLFIAIGLLTWSSEANIVDGCVYLDNFDITTALNEELGLTIQNNGNISQCLCVSGIHGMYVRGCQLFKCSFGTRLYHNQRSCQSCYPRDKLEPSCICHRSNCQLVHIDRLEVTNNRYPKQIDTGPGYGHCNYPGNSQPVCTQNDPCGYTVCNFSVCSMAYVYVYFRAIVHKWLSAIGRFLCLSASKLCLQWAMWPIIMPICSREPQKRYGPANGSGAAVMSVWKDCLWWIFGANVIRVYRYQYNIRLL
jgi:hypothetical protein